MLARSSTALRFRFCCWVSVDGWVIGTGVVGCSVVILLLGCEYLYDNESFFGVGFGA